MLSFALSLFIALSAFAKNECMKAVVSDTGTQFDEAPDLKTLDRAEEWLLRLGDIDASIKKGLAAYRSWQRWNSVTSEQRNHMLALELKLISPEVSTREQMGQLVKLDGRAQLKDLSAKNLRRMLLQLRMRHPDSDNLTSESKFARQAEDMSRTFKIVYAVPLIFSAPSSMSEPTSHPPLASPREMLRSGIYPQTTEYYSQLLSGAPSAAVSLRMVSGNQRAPAGLYLRPEIAKQEGFMMPEFQSPEDMITFFAAWDIEAVDQLWRENKMSFPSSVTSGRKMIEYFKNSGLYVDQVFTTDQPHKMRVLREKLKDYALSEDDGQTFLREAFRLYVLHLAERKPADYTRVTGELFVKLSPQTLQGFFDFIEFPNMTLRMPVAVSESDYTVVRQLPQAQAHNAPFYGSGGFASFEQRRAHDAGKPSAN